MNTKEVYLNDILLDLDEANNPIRLIYAVNDLGELKDRQAYSTNTFKLPNTQNNRKACGLPDIAQLIGVEPYRNNRAKIVQNGIEIMANGIGIITASGANIQLQILSGLIGFFDLLADKKISDLDLSDYDHVWNLATVANSQSNTEGFIYPIIDYGSLSDTERKAKAEQLRPATFRKTILERIVSETGYTISGLPLSYPKYLTSLIPFTNDKFTHGKAYSDLLAQYKTSARNTANFVIDSGQLNNTIQLNDDAATDPYNSWSGTQFVAPITARYRISFKYTLEAAKITAFGSTPELFTSIKVNGTDQAGNMNTVMLAPGDIQVFENQELTIEIGLQSGDVVLINALQQPATNRLYAFYRAGAEFKADVIVEDVIYGSEVQLEATLPDITQKNFFKEFLQNFGLIVIPNNYNKELLLINMEEVYANKPNAQDITSKLIDTEDEITYSFNGYGINNYGKYKEDDAVPDGTGDGVIVLDNLTLTDNVTLFTSVFAASVSVNKLGGVEVSEIKKIEDSTVSLDFKTKTQPRILLNRIVNGQFLIEDQFGSTVVNSVSVPLFTGLSYSELFTDNYPEIKRMLFRPFLVSKTILLKEIDIANIDWRIPVYDAKSASYYYKNQISYIQGNVSEISLIRMP